VICGTINYLRVCGLFADLQIICGFANYLQVCELLSAIDFQNPQYCGFWKSIEDPSLITGHKIKLYAHLLPTADMQQQNYPNLYPSRSILCTECNAQIYDNSHLDYCLAHLMELNQSLRTAATYLS
ncbi:hypothetical protein RclHR1_31600001, partial [Rhizophagus clarus]